MANDERLSPRAAIRTWLRQSNSKSRPDPGNVESQQHVSSHASRLHPTRREREVSSWTDPGDPPKRTRIGKSGACVQRDLNASIPKTSQRQEPQNQAKKASQPRPGSAGFAERLGLHAPFRNLRDHNEHANVDPEESSRMRKRKRKRKASSTTSYLEPAAAADLGDAENDEQSPYQRGKANKPLPSDKYGDTIALPGLLQRPDKANVTLEEPANSYERRPRHKTREDHYELKEGARRRKKPTREDGEGKKHKKHKRKEKSGAALMHSFTAHNVSHNRLTLQPAKPLGLFGKGRASSPVRRRVPDHAFSETAFLNCHRAKPNDTAKLVNSKPPDEKSKRKTSKTADTEAEISRYFTSAKASSGTARHPHTHPHGQLRIQEEQRQSTNTNSPPTFVELPDTPFLGFGSSGAISASPGIELDSRTLRDHERRLTRSPTHSTSLFTWSQSGVRSQASFERGDQRLVPLASSLYSNRRRSSLTSGKAEGPKPPTPSSAVHQLPIVYRDVATGTTPPNGLSKSSVNARISSVLHREDCSDSGVSSRAPSRTAGTRLEIEDQHPGVEPVPPTGVVEKKNSRQRESSVKRIYLSNASRASPTAVNPNEQRAETTDTFPAPHIHSPDSSPLDPLEIVLEGLLQENKQGGAVEEAPFQSEGQGKQYLRFGQQCTIAHRSGMSRHMPSPDVRSGPRIGEPYDTSLPSEHTGSSLDHVDEHPQRRHRTLKEEQSIQSFNYPVSRHSARSLARMSNIDYAPDTLPAPKGSQIGSRSVSHGYDNIYGQQQSRNSVASIEAPSFEDHNLRMNTELQRQTDSDAFHSAYYTHESGNLSVGMENHFNNYGPNLPETPSAFHGPHYAERDSLQDLELIQRSNDCNASTNPGYPSLTEPSHYHGSGGLTYIHNDELQLQDDHRVHQKALKPVNQDRSVAMDAPVSESRWHSTFGSIIPSAVGQAAIAHSDKNDPALFNFWTPHKLY